MTNPICAKCMIGQNSINGRYCKKLQRYVENSQEAVCKLNQK